MASQIFDMVFRTSWHNYENCSHGEVYQPLAWYTGHEMELDGCEPPCSKTKDLSSHSSPLRTRRKLQPSARKTMAAARLSSYPCPKDLAAERNDPRVHAAEAYLSLGPAINLNETQHRRTTSFHSDMAHSMLRFLGGADYYPHGTIGHDSAILEPESLFRICMKAKILASLCQHILLWHHSVNANAISPVSLRISCDRTTDARQLNCLECNHIRCENCQRKRIKSGV